MTDETLDRARAGDQEAFRQLTDRYRRELDVHIYRLLGSRQEAEDVLQETLLAAWRGLGQFEGRASVRAWLYRIATNRSMDAIRAKQRRPEERQLPPMPNPTRWNEQLSIEPYPDTLLESLPDDTPGPEARYEAKEAIALAFIVGLQHVPPDQRAVLVLRDVLGFRSSEVAGMLETSEASVNGQLRRAREAFETRLPAIGRDRASLPETKLERETIAQFAESVQAGDIERVVAMLTDDAWLTMPPLPHAYQGPEPIGVFLLAAEQRRGVPLRLVPTRANRQPAFGCYVPTPDANTARATAMFVISLDHDQISAITWFADPTLPERFGLPAALQ